MEPIGIEFLLASIAQLGNTTDRVDTLEENTQKLVVSTLEAHGNTTCKLAGVTKNTSYSSRIKCVRELLSSPHHSLAQKPAYRRRNARKAKFLKCCQKFVCNGWTDVCGLHVIIEEPLQMQKKENVEDLHQWKRPTPSHCSASTTNGKRVLQFNKNVHDSAKTKRAYIFKMDSSDEKSYGDIDSTLTTSNPDTTSIHHPAETSIRPNKKYCRNLKEMYKRASDLSRINGSTICISFRDSTGKDKKYKTGTLPYRLAVL
jgi:hypothetical protein